MSDALSKAFMQMQPNEVVVFGLIEREASGLMKMTTGGWFARDDRLHLVLANYRFAVTMDSVRELLVKDPLRPNTGRTFDLVAGPYQRLVTENRLVQLKLDPDPVELAVAYHSLLAPATEPMTGAGTATGQVAPSTGSERPVSPASSLEERLDRLKRLRESGRITEEEYREKRKELLGQL